MEKLVTYDVAREWLNDVGSKPPHLLLGNGFSVAYDNKRFSYQALKNRAESQKLIGKTARKLFKSLNTFDFEEVIQGLQVAARALRALKPKRYAKQAEALEAEARSLKEVLAKTLAGLHPERPTDISDATYVHVRAFLDEHSTIYTANYDLLLYWALMQDSPPLKRSRNANDGFRDPGYDANYVTLDKYESIPPTVFYLHGALHIYRDMKKGEIQKLTWKRTGNPLIDQIRHQLSQDRFPLIVTEGSSESKLAQIQNTDYLSRGLRSLANISNGLLIYGLSMSPNDEHLKKAIVHSKVTRVAISIYGDPADKRNRKTIRASNRLVADRKSRNSKHPLEVKFYDAETIKLWN
ncbi:DUF4917 family protein [Rathayibacter rathayi]|uniref:DUF4917 family protein n=1 Tax=Rathayibacter rathayi TaxID=33887 RepID=UPI000CE858E3|nr:DUF4917 family protein [Rathayibacter rathayi]PPH67644.1 DUF4917 domain-containing protein [Rathayibacter rathayi]PPI03361.1 DUF4917 domain-containing protein [Rathayibacter rathayi]PPI10008.1 DUF4917 domain-containing protein [Rathayibacter rathayi]